MSHAEPTPYMVPEHVDGTNLHAVVAEGKRLSVARTVDDAIQPARGLDHASAGAADPPRGRVLSWCVTDGQSRAFDFGAAPLPPGATRALEDPATRADR